MLSASNEIKTVVTLLPVIFNLLTYLKKRHFCVWKKNVNANHCKEFELYFLGSLKPTIKWITQFQETCCLFG